MGKREAPKSAFKKGHPGYKPKGAVSKTTQAIRELLNGHVDRAVEVLRAALDSEDEGIRIRAADSILRRTVPELKSVEMTDTMQKPVNPFEGLTIDELRRLAGKDRQN